MSDATIAAGTEQRLTAQELKAQEKAAKKTEKERLKRVARDEKAERKRAAKSGFANVANPRRSTLLTIVCALFAVYCLFPFVYLLINATKTQADFTSTFGLGFGRTFALWDNIKTVFTYQDGIFGRWFLNTVLYVVVGAGGATLLAIMGGYALAKFRFPGRKVVFAVIIGAISVPGIAGTDLDIYARAREFMAKNGNPTQWGDNYPSPELLEEDIDTNRLFVYMVNGRMQAVFAFVLGEDPTYKVIEDGQWLNDTLPYGTLHRLASAGESKF